MVSFYATLTTRMAARSSDCFRVSSTGYHTSMLCLDIQDTEKSSAHLQLVHPRFLYLLFTISACQLCPVEFSLLAVSQTLNLQSRWTSPQQHLWVFCQTRDKYALHRRHVWRYLARVALLSVPSGRKSGWEASSVCRLEDRTRSTPHSEKHRSLENFTNETQVRRNSDQVRRLSVVSERGLTQAQTHTVLSFPFRRITPEDHQGNRSSWSINPHALKAGQRFGGLEPRSSVIGRRTDRTHHEADLLRLKEVQYAPRWTSRRARVSIKVHHPFEV